MTSAQAARRLGVKPETLYAYVSRGLIHSERIPGQRRGRFLRSDVERHALRSGGRGRPGPEIVIETEITHLDPDGHLAYRGWDVAEAARVSTAEAVASWVWTGEATPTPFLVDERSSRAITSLLAPLSTADLVPMDRWRIALGVLRSADPMRGDLRPAAVTAAGRQIIAALVASLECHGLDPGPDVSVAARLWPRLTAAPPSERRVRALDAVLVCMLDHEMATSTLAARVAASTRADPYLVVQAGLAALGGPLHGGAAEQVRALVRDAGVDGSGAAAAIGDRLAVGQRIPGLGHQVYRRVDPRFAVIREAITAAGIEVPAADALLAVAAARDLPFPNCDFAIGALAEACDFVPGAPEIVFGTARIVGWLGHAIEEYRHALRYRTSATYIGPRAR